MKSILIFFLCIIIYVGHSQNLVLNSSFEDTTISYNCSSSRPAGYYNVVTNWNNAANFPASGSGSSSDKYCSSSLLVPTNPNTGVQSVGFAGGMFLDSKPFTEAVTTNLITSISSGSSISMSLALKLFVGDTIQDPNALLGLYFYSGGNVPESGGVPFDTHHLTATPQVIIPATSLIVNTWTTLSFNYTIPFTATKVAIGYFNPTSSNVLNPKLVIIDDVVITSCLTTDTNTTSTANICELGTKSLTSSGSGGSWSIVSGGGSILGTTYTAPSVSSNTSVTIKYRVPANGSCPADSSNVTFTVTNSVPLNNTTLTDSICSLGTKSLTGTPSGGVWSLVSGGGSILGTTYTAPGVASNTPITIKYKTPGSGGCPADSANVTFNVEPTPTSVITSSNAAMCNGDKRLLTGTPTGGFFSVLSGPGTMLTNDTLQATSSGTIQVQYRVSNACGNKDTTQSITVSSSIAVAITNSTASFCEDLTRTLTGTPGGGTWRVLSGPATVSGGVLTPTGSGTVSIEYAVTSSCGNGADTVDIVINPLPNASAGIDEDICTGDTVNLTATGGGVYQWVPGPATAINQVFPTVTTGYRVDVTSDSGCIASDSLTVFVQASGIATAQDDQAIVITGVQESIDIYTNDLGGINTLTILSAPNNGTGTISGGNVLYTSTTGYLGSDTIEYEICDGNCQTVCDTAFLYITVESDLTIPIGVSPNNDGKNDVFNVLGLSRYPNNSLFIYNRWGSLIFKAEPYLNDWDGQSISGEVIEGTYFYILELGEDIEPYNGYIELKK